MILAGLAAIPYIASSILYYVSYRDLFAEPKSEEPRSWRMNLLAPVLIATFVPLPLAASDQLTSSQREILLAAVGLSFLCTFVLLIVTSRTSYFSLLNHPGFSNWEVATSTWAQGLLIVGLGLMLFTGIVTVSIAAASHS